MVMTTFGREVKRPLVVSAVGLNFGIDFAEEQGIYRLEMAFYTSERKRGKPLSIHLRIFHSSTQQDFNYP
jgi:hypothetical protein